MIEYALAGFLVGVVVCAIPFQFWLIIDMRDRLLDIERSTRTVTEVRVDDGDGLDEEIWGNAG